MIKWKMLQKDSLVRQRKMLVIILATVLFTTLVLIIGFVAWLELYMVYSTVVPISPVFHVAVPGEPAVSARLYRLGSPLVGYTYDLLVLTSKSSGHREFYYIDWGHHEIGLPSAHKYVPLFGTAIVDRITLEKFPLGGELKAEWNENESEVRMRVMGFSDAAVKAEGTSDPDEVVARRRMPIGYQREIIFTKRQKDRPP
jgi:hypothetical protein